MHYPKHIDWLGGWNRYMYVLPLTTSFYLTPKLYVIILYFWLIMFPVWLAIVIIFYFLSGYWFWKLINIFYCSDYVAIIHFVFLSGKFHGQRSLVQSMGSQGVRHDWVTLMSMSISNHDWSREKNVILPLIEKHVIAF